MFFDYEFQNFYEGMRSPAGTVENDYNTRYFMRCLYQRLMSVIDFDLPDGWNKQYFKNVLFRNGFIGIVPTENYGVIPQICSLSGYGLYMQPTDIIVAQPLVSFRGTIGEDCELIKIAPDYMGVFDIVEHYARQMSICFTSINMSLENSRIAVLIGARNKQAAETLKAIAEKISAGEATIIFDKKLTGDDLSGNEPIWSLSYDVKSNYITDKLLTDIDTILAQFDREIGIPTVDDKKERMLTDEIVALTNDSCSRLKTWTECINESVDNVNALFDLNLSFRSILDQDTPEELTTGEVKE